VTESDQPRFCGESLDNIITAEPGDHDKPYEFDAPASMLLRFDRYEWNRMHAQKDRRAKIMAAEFCCG
jgi:hypothetical protein